MRERLTRTGGNFVSKYFENKKKIIVRKTKIKNIVIIVITARALFWSAGFDIVLIESR